MPFREKIGLMLQTFKFGRALALLVAVWSLVGLVGCGSGVSVKKASFDELVHDVETKSYLVKQFRAKFEKTRRSALFDRELTVNGCLVFQKPNKFQLIMSGAVNVEILSDGETITIIHDGHDQETYHVQGERDLSRFADPLMVLLQGMGNGGLRRFSVAKQSVEDNSVLLEAKPNGELYFERTKKVMLRLSESGEIKGVRLYYKDGDYDETVFRSWSMLARDDPDIVRLNRRLQKLSRKRGPTRTETVSGQHLPGPVQGAACPTASDKRSETTL